MFRHSLIRIDIRGIECLSRYSHATEEKVKWATSHYEKWRAARNLEVKHNKDISAICPTVPIEKMTQGELPIVRFPASSMKPESRMGKNILE